MVAALGSWLDARAQGGSWLIRIEDIDTPRCVEGSAELILEQLAKCGLLPDEPPIWQSQRTGAYEQALQQLWKQQSVYRCICSRRQIAEAWQARGWQRDRHAELPYPGSCRERTDIAESVRCAIRVRCASDDSPLNIDWIDRRLGPQQQDLSRSVGDFVVRRSDSLWAYQLAVVVDDAAEAISDVVRGEDLADNTARQIHLQRLLVLATPRYLHLPLVLGADGEKLSKQNGATAVDVKQPLLVLQAAGQVLGITHHADHVGDWLAEAVKRWAILHCLGTRSGAVGQSRYDVA